MATYSVDPEEVLRFQMHRLVTSLFKSFLIILEDLGAEHDEALEKLYTALPEEYKPFVNLADYFTEQKGELLRKKVLDAGNDTRRQIDEVLKSFTITLKN